MLHVGASIGYWQGDPKKILDDVDALKPTLFCGVPRVYERVYNGVQDKVREGLQPDGIHCSKAEYTATRAAYVGGWVGPWVQDRAQGQASS